MGMTMTQKILAAHAGLDAVTAGQLIVADLDMALANDITAPVAVREMEKAGGHVKYKDRVALVMDHGSFYAQQGYQGGVPGKMYA